MADAPRIAVEPQDYPTRPWLVAAVEAGGGEVVASEAAQGLIWAANTGVDALRAGVDRAANATWVQLPWAGIEPFVEALDNEHTWTCGKGVYAEPVAELALTLALAGFRKLDAYTRAQTWSPQHARNLVGANVVILGGGGITESLVRFLRPFDCRITVLRRHPVPMDGVAHVGTLTELDAMLADADLVVLALALTPETRGIIGAQQLAGMKPTAWIVNVARGAHIDTDALVEVLRDRRIGGAGLDVFAVEPLPDGHPLWSLENCISRPRRQYERMAQVCLSARNHRKFRRFGAGGALLGSWTSSSVLTLRV